MMIWAIWVALSPEIVLVVPALHKRSVSGVNTRVGDARQNGGGFGIAAARPCITLEATGVWVCPGSI